MECLYNSKFKPIEFDRFLNEADANAFTLSPTRWITSTNAKGIRAKRGRGGGVFAHKDIFTVSIRLPSALHFYTRMTTLIILNIYIISTF